jgi:transcriptional regulator with XRE-family HTH domain
VDESRQWVEFGRWVAEQRDERGLRRREAAKRAKISEALWRDLETGRKEAIGGIRLLPNPSREVLQGVADALEVPLEEVLSRIGRSAPKRPSTPSSSAGDTTKSSGEGSTLSLKLRRLSERDLRVVERMVDVLLEVDRDDR